MCLSSVCLAMNPTSSWNRRLPYCRMPLLYPREVGFSGRWLPRIRPLILLPFFFILSIAHYLHVLLFLNFSMVLLALHVRVQKNCHFFLPHHRGSKILSGWIPGPLISSKLKLPLSKLFKLGLSNFPDFSINTYGMNAFVPRPFYQAFFSVPFMWVGKFYRT